MSGNLTQIKKRFVVLLSIFGVIDLALLVLLLWPGSSHSAQLEQERSLQQQYQSLGREVGPLRGIDKQLLRTRADIKDFYKDKVPTRYSEVSQRIEKLTQENGVATQSIRYAPVINEKTDLQDVERIEIDTTITGDYAKVARFINAIEQDKLMFVIKQVSLNGQQEAGSVSLQIKFETFVKQSA